MSDQYLALLRGINVGRANRVSMTELRILLGDLGYAGVQTLLSSGNVVFAAPATPTVEVASTIEQALTSRLGLSVQVIVVSAAELAAIVEQNPLVGVCDDPTRLLVIFSREPPDPRLLTPLLERDWSPEALASGQHATYMWCPAGVIEGPLAQSVARALGKSVTTTRNWATVSKVHRLLRTPD